MGKINLKVGHVVIPTRGNGIVLTNGSGRNYGGGVVVSTEPFVMVSECLTMVWKKQDPNNFTVSAVLTDNEMVSYMRYFLECCPELHNEKDIPIPSIHTIGTKRRVVELHELIDFVTLVRKKVGAFCKEVDAEIYWRNCAIRELIELSDHYSWEVWKPDTPVDYASAQLEAVDVFAFMVAAINANYESKPMHKAARDMVCYYDQGNPFVIRGVEQQMLSDNPSDTFATVCYKMIHDVQSHQTFAEGFNCLSFVDLVTHLSQLTKLNGLMFGATVVAKMALVSARLVNGKYRKAWVKDSDKEVAFLNESLRTFENDQRLVLNDLINMVQSGACKFLNY